MTYFIIRFIYLITLLAPLDMDVKLFGENNSPMGVGPMMMVGESMGGERRRDKQQQGISRRKLLSRKNQREVFRRQVRKIREKDGLVMLFIVLPYRLLLNQ